MKKKQKEKLTDAVMGLADAFDLDKMRTVGLRNFAEDLFDFLSGFSLNVHVLVTGRDEVNVEVSIRDKQP